MVFENNKCHHVRHLPHKVIVWSSGKSRLFSFLLAERMCSPLARRKTILCPLGGCKGIWVVLVWISLNIDQRQSLVFLGITSQINYLLPIKNWGKWDREVTGKKMQWRVHYWEFHHCEKPGLHPALEILVEYAIAHQKRRKAGVFIYQLPFFIGWRYSQEHFTPAFLDCSAHAFKKLPRH